MACQFFHFFWSSPVQMLIATGILIWQLGLAALAGCALVVLSVPLQYWVGNTLKSYRGKVNATADTRVRITQEALAGVKVVKVYSWEESFYNIIGDVRRNEMKSIKFILILRACVSGFLQTVPILAAIITFIIYVRLGNTLTAAVAFSSLALFYVLRIPLLVYPTVISQIADALVAIRRIQSFLEAEEVRHGPVRADQDRTVGSARGGVSVTDSSFVWESAPVDSSLKKAEQKSHTTADVGKTHFTGLKNLNFKIPPGTLCAVVGHVGCGKTSLLHSLIGEMKKTSGTVELFGSVAYCAQSAWIQNLTLRDNIIFGKPFDEQKYWKVIDDCALSRDLEMLAAGDMTEIGEKGINLSGGQKQRVNIARALYSDSDTIFLDDPLSAVDAHVGTHLFGQCIQTAMAGTTRMLITHRLHVLPLVDYILVMENGEIVEQGTYEDLHSKGDKSPVFASLMKDVESSEDAMEKPKQEAKNNETPKAATKAPVKMADKSRNANIIKIEDRETGQVGIKFYKEYIKLLGGYWLFGLILFTIVISQLSRIANDYWLAILISKPYSSLNVGDYDWIYLGLGAFQSIAMMVPGVLCAFGSALASRRLHQGALKNVLSAPMAWFDSQPMGRIVNRFSRDQDTVDSLLPDSFRVFLYTFSMTLSILIYIAVILPYFIIPMVPVLVLYWFTQRFYRRSSVELKRLDNITRSPFFAFFGETLTGSGQATIRAYAVQERFLARNVELLDYNNRAYYMSIIGQRWLSLRLEGMATVLIFFASLLGVILRDSLDPALIALGITYALQVTFVFNWCVKQATELEMYMNSVERLVDYTENLENEAVSGIPLAIDEEGHELKTLQIVPDESWPSRGDISFENVHLRYRPDLPDVLNNVSFSVQSQTKVGIVGRTGAGKSSLIYALFLLTRPHKGKIVIDGQDIQSLPINVLRHRLAIIPQDPVVFSGTLRSNLDPFAEHTDEEMWECLTRCGLTDAVDPAKGLDMEVAESGENWSMGQRQLICLARAMLKKSKIIILDEATASVDMATDTLIQTSLRKYFATCTIVTIAHRLFTIMDYAQIVVLDQGKVIETGSPAELMASKGVFHSMVMEQEISQN